MKNVRQTAIADLISKKNILTQKDLVDNLTQMGFSAAQATISRDIKALGLTREPFGDGLRYVLPVSKNHSFINNNIISIAHANNMLVIKTNSGMAMAVAASIDVMKLHDILGTIAGDDTIFCVIRSEANIEKVLECFM